MEPHCLCPACKRGVKYPKRKIKPVPDKRSWGVEHNGELVSKSWYRATAIELAKLLNVSRGKGHKAVAVKTGRGATVRPITPTVPEGE